VRNILKMWSQTSLVPDPRPLVLGMGQAPHVGFAQNKISKYNNYRAKGTVYTYPQKEHPRKVHSY